YATGQKERWNAEGSSVSHRCQIVCGVALKVGIKLIVIQAGSRNCAPRNTKIIVICRIQGGLEEKTLGTLVVAGEAVTLIHYPCPTGPELNSPNWEQIEVHVAHPARQQEFMR